MKKLNKLKKGCTLLCQVTLPDLMNDSGRPKCILFDAYWHDKHNDTSPTALPRFYEGVNYVNVFVTCDVIYNDAI